MVKVSAGLIALIAVILIFSGITIYSGEFPPASVVESESMEHSSTWTWGTINVGDIVIVKNVPDPVRNVITYVVGRETNFSTYGEYGDVILYHDPDGDIVIHRAMFYLSWNNGTPVVAGYANQSWLSIHGQDIIIYDCGYSHRNLLVNVSEFVNESGFITVGDHNLATSPLYNSRYDAYLAADQNVGIMPTPVKAGEVLGVARGQIPWFGLIKLNIMRAEGDWPYYNEVPANSYLYLGISLAAIFGAIFFPYRSLGRKRK
ncbi:MAG: S26 family signal peptidase [Candidatus Thermoplasmatota archaeon]|nr:S26 family signal peptidase [Candidatus Thermoplasmatota archaeon]